MARRRDYTTNNAYRAIERLAEERAMEVAQDILGHIRSNAPYDKKRRKDREGGPHLADSFYARIDDVTGDVLIKSRRRYWAFVEFGTKEHSPTPDRNKHFIRNAIEYARARRR